MRRAKGRKSKMLRFPTEPPLRVALVMLACPVVTEVYMAAAPLIVTQEHAPFGRRLGYARGVWAGSRSELGRFVLKLATNSRATFTNWLRIDLNSGDASDTHRPFQEDQT